jgi:hypothetical protein
MTRARRWSPGKGFIKINEWGAVATWMKPLPHGALLALYLPRWQEEGRLVEHWMLYLPRGCDFHWDILDKPWRIRWLLDADEEVRPGSLLWGVKILLHETRRPSHHRVREQHRRMWGCWHRGYRHTWPNRRRGRNLSPYPGEGSWNFERVTRIPGKILAGLEPSVKDKLLAREYLDWLMTDIELREKEMNHDHNDVA